METYAVIPAHNESRTITSVVTYMLLRVDHVIVVDDASTDMTGSLAAKAGAIVFTNAVNKGYEPSLNKGLRKALELGGKIVITCDADGQHSLPIIDELIASVRDKNVHVAVGSRRSLPRFSEQLFSSLTFARYKIKDITSGLKCYSDHALRSSDIESPWNSIGSYITLFCLKNKLNVINIPICVKPREGKSRFGNGLMQELIILRAVVRSFVGGY